MVVRFERIEACNNCGSRYRVVVEDILSGTRNHREAACECGHMLASQTCHTLNLEKVPG